MPERMVHWVRKSWRRLSSILYRRLYLRAFLAEFLSTYCIITLIIGLVAQAVLTDGEKAHGIAIPWGAAVASMTGLWIALGASGAHSNPAFSLLFTLRGFITWSMLPVYWTGQYLGAMAGAATALGVYWEALIEKTNGEFIMTNEDPGLAIIFATYPAPYVSTAGAIGEQLLISGLLALCITAITDRRNMRVPPYLIALYLGYFILALTIGLSLNTGGSPNPARDLSPRIVSYFLWGINVFSFRNWTWFWIPVIVPHIGVFLGYGIYFLLIEAHWPVE